jgi:hypothetical protein
MVTLQAVSGPVTGRRIEVPAGTIVRIGRTAKSDCALGEDAYLSGQHFCMEYDGTHCRVRDLGSSNGTFLNGDRVTESEVKEGDSIAAGGTTFTVHVESTVKAAGSLPSDALTADGPPKIPTLRFAASEGAPSAAVSPTPSSVTTTASAAGAWRGFSPGQVVLLDAVYRENIPVFAFLDPIRDSRIPAFLDASGERYARVEETLAQSPYLVTLPPEARLLDVLVKDGWGRGWGFCFTSNADFDELRLHWRSYVMLRSERGREITFRFWDPRVMRAILPAMPPAEGREFLGPVSRVIVEGDRPEVAMEFSWSPRGVQQQALVLI